MGCCYSCFFDPGVPDNDEWRHMPAPDSAENYTIQKCGMFSKDYNVYHGTDEPSEDNRQLWMNKEGDWWTGKAYIDIENFHLKTEGEPNNPDDEKRGQVLWHSQFIDTPHFEQHVSFGAGRHERFLGFFDGYDSDDDDEYYGRVSHSGQFWNKFIVKFSCRTSAKISPGKTKKGVSFRPGIDLTLNVFSKGTAVRIVTRTWEEDRDEEGNVTGHHWAYHNHDQEFVDWIEYKLTAPGGVTVAIFRCQGTGNSSTWECPIFKATKEGGFFSEGDCNVETKAGWDPLLGLMLAHLCSSEYSPNQIKRDFVPNFPGRNRFRYGKANRPHGNLWYAPEGDDRDQETLNGTDYEGGISIDPEMFQAIPGYNREFYMVPPFSEEELAAEAEEEQELNQEKPKIEIDWGDLANCAPTQPCAVLRKVPAHMETDPETGLLIFVPISFEALTPPPAQEKVEEEIEVVIDESDDEE
ncbi:hypothetical protein TrST_g3335 [Triparma strigata]|uniref:Uncharacterized protein n=1 Tax=Triparma strigata TaxID=1606541 RepID=A0A9W7AIC7_9STRA|nr:hypothetical protein TrST_g3335 [Triparma strigata]